mmetsp:Transcript_28738/g.72166  ORF Transcript_28738/g.72166 Transcript_28738/m.72166 type:complete len:141 (+) Transcript_28738:45-467(+)
MGCKCSCEEEKADESMLQPPRADDQVMAQEAVAGADQDFKAPAPPRYFEYVISKVTQDEKLGFDVRHVHGKLEVVQVFNEGAIERTNKEAEARNPPGEQLVTGDVIERVNGVEGNDNQMVAECRLQSQLTFVVCRGVPAS